MGLASKQKGKRGEREVANLLKEYGYPGRRGVQYCGIFGDSDVVGMDGVHIEVKRTEKFRLYDAMEQSKHDAKPGEIPTVWHRQNDREWVVVLDARDFIHLFGGKK